MAIAAITISPLRVVVIPAVCMSLLLFGLNANAQQWTLATDDTRLTIGVDAQGLPTITNLENPAEQFNWTQQPSTIPLPGSVVLNGQNVATNWQFLDATVDNSSGTKVTLSYASPTTGLQMTSQWWAKPGAGPIHHASSITNSGGLPVGISYQPTLALQLTTPQTDAVQAWHFATDGGYLAMDPQGVYQEPLTGDFNRTLRTDPNAANGSIPLAVLDSGGRQGLYVGTEWSYGDIQIASAASTPGKATVRSGNVLDFQTTLQPGGVFEVPPGFVGTYKGDIDDAGNSLRKYLYNYNTPDVLRNDPTYPKVQWNAFIATGKTPGSWDSVQSKYYPLIDDAYALGFEEVTIDVNWWLGSEPNADPIDWSSGMKAAADYAHQRGMRFGLYWTDGADMTTAAGRTTRANRIKRLFEEYDADVWRSDNTGGALIASDYWSVKGFYEMVDGLQQELPDFQWENCSSGGRIKDYGAMQRSVKIFNSDNCTELEVRTIFYDTSFAFLPMQIEGHQIYAPDGGYRPHGSAGVKSAFRSVSMGAPGWIIDAPNGSNSSPWTNEEKAAAASAVHTYETRIRPLVRNANLYHIFARPDGVVWDGIEYYDPETYEGVVYIFKPNSPYDTHTICLKGLDADQMYYLSFEDGSNSTVQLLGADLMNVGVDVTLYGENVSELMFIGVDEPALPPMVTNGDFSAGIWTWSLTDGTSGWHDGTEANPSPNGGSAWFQGPGWFYQPETTPLVAGQTYELSFSAALLSTNGDPQDECIVAHVSDPTGQPYAYITPRLTETWTDYSFQFTPTADNVGEYTVAFLNSLAGYPEAFGGGGGTDHSCIFGIDNVSLTAVIELLLPGDANGDGVVNDADAAVLATNWQTASDATWGMGDFNGDGAVNDVDASILAANWQLTATKTTPEPATLILIGLGALYLCCLRRRKAS